MAPFGGFILSDDDQLLGVAGVVHGSTIFLSENSDGYVIVTVPTALQATYGDTITVATTASTRCCSLRLRAWYASVRHLNDFG